MAVAIHSYLDNQGKGKLPPRAIFSQDGKPLLSWRVLILPYIEQDALFKKIKLDEPWDSPHNFELLQYMPSLYGPFEGRTKGEPTATFFQAFVGPGAAFEGIEGLRIKEDFPDGRGQTILLAIARKAVPWTKPVDMDYAPDQPLPGLGGIFPNTYQVVMVDCTTRSLSHKVSEKTLRAAITRNGKDKLGPDWEK